MPEERKPQAEEKYIIRFPDGMRDRLKEAAKANSRTMNAEIVARLEESFRERSSDNTNWQAVLQATSLHHELGMSDMRLEMIKLRGQSLGDRHSLLAAEVELLAKAAQTDEDFAKVEARMASMRVLEGEIKLLQKELEQVATERQAALDKITELRKSIAEMNLKHGSNTINF